MRTSPIRVGDIVRCGALLHGHVIDKQGRKLQIRPINGLMGPRWITGRDIEAHWRRSRLT